MVSIFDLNKSESNLSESTAVITEDKVYASSEIYDMAKEIASVVPSRSLVVLVATNTIETLTAYIGFLSKSVIPLFTASSITAEALKSLIEDYTAEYIWCPKHCECPGQVVYSLLGFKLLFTGSEREAEPYTELALLLPTSGSTGSNKYVRLSYKNVASNAQSIAEYLKIRESDRAITTLPFSYSYGLSIINSHLLVGASLVLTERTLFEREFWTLCKETKATTFGGVPYTYTMLKGLRFARMELPALRYITQAGGRLGEELHQEFAAICKDKDIDFVVMYGQTEATARLSYLPAELALEKVGSIGIPIPGGSFELIDDTGKSVVDTNCPGELVYRGDNVSLGYATHRADLQKGDERQGVLHTGDIAVFDDDGCYRIVGRMSRFLKIFGNRVNLDELDALLSAAGIEAVCSGTDDNLVVYYVSGGSNEDVRSAICSKTSLNYNAFSVKHIQSIPRNDSGKIQYSRLEDAC